MKSYFSLFVGLLLLALTVPAQAQLFAKPANREETTLNDASRCLKEIMEIPANSIPEALFEKAEGVAIFPNLVKGSFVIGGQHGYGILVVKNSEAKWEAPRFLSMSGGSIGFQAGIQAADVILIFCTQRSVKAALDGDFTIGADASVAAGPVGRQAMASTNYEFNSELYSYSRSRGLFLGVAVDGCVLKIDEKTNRNYYVNGIPAPARSVVELIDSYVKEDGQAQAPNAETSPVAPAPETLEAPNSVSSQLPASSDPLPPPPADVQMTDREAARVLLVPAHENLMKILDPEWQKWLALPPEAQTPGSTEVTPNLQSLYDRLEKVAADPKYAELTARPEFDRVRSLMKVYLGK
ncbi:MAG: lipid-binding SYLF domain-containing protein [Thermoguttaceae bacterium]|nr:lipid-binding SYLF domain-containing protein [Thermoguttaceae bacterium]